MARSGKQPTLRVPCVEITIWEQDSIGEQFRLFNVLIPGVARQHAGGRLESQSCGDFSNDFIAS
jgi:hypothetical protein